MCDEIQVVSRGDSDKTVRKGANLHKIHRTFSTQEPCVTPITLVTPKLLQKATQRTLDEALTENHSPLYDWLAVSSICAAHVRRLSHRMSTTLGTHW